jgi:hypothetical protein
MDSELPAIESLGDATSDIPTLEDEVATSAEEIPESVSDQ